MDVITLIPRTRRAIDGPTASGSAAVSATLTDPQITALIADAIADVIFYTDGAWPYVLSGADEDFYGSPTSYAIEPDLPLEGQTVVIAQAALNYYYSQISDAQISESIRNEAQEWSWARSASLLTDRLKFLRDMRDRALEILIGGGSAYQTYVSFLAVRDATTSAIIEPWVEHQLIGSGGQVDYRFGY